MMHRAWSSNEEVPYCFSRSSVKFQGHMALKIVEFDSNWAFPDCISSLNWPMAMKCCTKLETAEERCPIVLQGHPANFKVTRDKTSLILTQIGRFRIIGRSQLSNPSDLPCYAPAFDLGTGNNMFSGYPSTVLPSLFPSDQPLPRWPSHHWWKTNIGSGDGLMPSCWQAIIWSSADLDIEPHGQNKLNPRYKFTPKARISMVPMPLSLNTQRPRQND